MHMCVLAVWLLVAAMYNGVIFVQKGFEHGIQWFTGYVLEWLLSMDNLFVFHLIFQAYSTPKASRPKALLIGILGAVVFRMVFFLTLSSLIHMFRWVLVVFGLLLLYSAVQAVREEEDDGEEATDNFLIRGFRSVFGSRIQDTYDSQGRMFVWAGEQWEMTLLVPVALCLVVTDLLFAVDSVSAKVAQIPDSYIAYSSTVIALFGLRTLFFIIQSLVDLFVLLKYGLCFILAFIGVEL